MRALAEPKEVPCGRDVDDSLLGMIKRSVFSQPSRATRDRSSHRLDIMVMTMGHVKTFAARWQEHRSGTAHGAASASGVAYGRRLSYRVGHRSGGVGKESCVGLLLED